MKNLTKTLLAILVITVVFSSCKKNDTGKNSNSSSTPTMKFSANGTAVTYNSCLALAAQVGGQDETVITATNMTNGNPGPTTFQVQVNHAVSSLKAGQTYAAATTFGQADGSAMIYFTNDTDYFATQPGNPQGSVTITDITSGIIKGTFTGKLYDPKDFDGKDVKYTITSGTFVAVISK